MARQIKKVFGILALAAPLLSPARLHADEVRYAVGLGFEFASGSYGTGIHTDAVFLPFTVAVYPTQRLDFSLELPFIYQSTSAVVAGQYMAMQGQAGAPQPSMLAGTMMGGGMRTSASGSNVDTSQYGLGDTKLKAGYVLYTEEEYVPAIRPNVYLKIPTADKNKFLGTGAFDGGFAVELSKWYGDWFADGELGYTIQGKSDILAVKNYLYYYAGGGYQVGERLRPMLLVKGSTTTTEGGGPLLELRLRTKYQLSTHLGLDGYLAKGIETASPDYGLGLAVSYQF